MYQELSQTQKIALDSLRRPGKASKNVVRPKQVPPGAPAALSAPSTSVHARGAEDPERVRKGPPQHRQAGRAGADGASGSEPHLSTRVVSLPGGQKHGLTVGGKAENFRVLSAVTSGTGYKGGVRVGDVLTEVGFEELTDQDKSDMPRLLNTSYNSTLVRVLCQSKSAPSSSCPRDESCERSEDVEGCSSGAAACSQDTRSVYALPAT